MQKIETSMLLLRQLLSMVHLKALVIYFGNMKAYFINYPKVFKLQDWESQFKGKLWLPLELATTFNLKRNSVMPDYLKKKKGRFMQMIKPLSRL